MKNKIVKKGFTLIELLTVVVVLAVVSLIAVPIIFNIIDKAKKGAAKESARAYMEAVETYMVMNSIAEKETNIKLMSNSNDDKLVYLPNNNYYLTQNTIIDGKNYLAINDVVDIKGTKPTGLDDYITLDSSRKIKDGKLTEKEYVVNINDGKITSVNKGKKINVESMDLCQVLGHIFLHIFKSVFKFIPISSR